jgi:D-alanyl-D-alanine carboxypeptidase/D-alanyl-D-alanine-endopeptidase (penicillin-binding protein 4)
VIALALASIDARPARPQDAGEPAAAPPADDPATADEPEPGPTAAGPASQAPADPGARKAWLTHELDAAIARRPALGAVAVAIIDVTSGDPIYAHDATTGYNLASCTKLLTSSAALARLGPGFRWRTAIYADKFTPADGVVDGDLYVRGRGDPTLDDRALRELAIDLRRAGVRRVTGALVIDASYFDDVVEPPHFGDQPKERSGYRAPIAGFAVDESAVTVVIEPVPSGEGAAAIHLEPPVGDYVRIREAAVATVRDGRSRVRVDAVPRPHHLELTILGQVKADGGVDLTRRRVDDPIEFAAEALRAVLVDEDIAIGKRVERGRVPRTAHQLVAHDSPPLADVIRRMNKLSDNFIAESLLKTLGAERRAQATPPNTDPAPATWADGQAAVSEFLVGEVGLAAGSFRAENGSGLYEASAVPALALARVVAHAERDFRWGPDLIASLAIAGVDGTLHRRLAGTPNTARVRAKTGTLAKVSTLAGLLAVDGRHPLAFAILMNSVPENGRAAARALQDEILIAALGYAAP